MLKAVSKRCVPKLRKQSPSSCSSKVTQLLRNSQATSVDMKIPENIIKKIILEEQLFSLADILIRRTGLGWSTDQGKSATSEVATMMAELKGWDEQRKEKEIQSFQQHIKEIH
jgi:glycerol-3-phosphate dehydrogenase